MNEHQKLVRDFHLKFGLTVNDAPTLSPADDILRVNLIHEEAMELWEAERDLVSLVDTVGGVELEAKKARIAIADALGDLAYVTYGAGVTYGLDVRSDDDLTDVVTRSFAGQFLAQNGDFAMELQSGRFVETVQNALSVMMDLVEAACFNYDIPLDPVFLEIHRSNMSKLWTPRECMSRFGIAEEMVKASELGYSFTPVDSEGEKRWCVKRMGKVQKSPSYSLANLAHILYPETATV